MDRPTIINYRASHLEHEMLKTLACYEGRTLSETLRECVRECAARRGLFLIPVSMGDVFQPKTDGEALAV